MTSERTDPDPDPAPARPDDGAVRGLASDLAVVALDPNGRLTALGADAESLAGWTDDVVGDPFTVLYPDGERQTALSRARTEGRFEEEGWCHRADGSRFWASVSITPRGGKQAGFTLVVQDRTDRKRIEDERALLAEVSRTVASAETFADGVETVLSAVCDHTQWAYGEAWVPTDDGELEQLVAHAGEEELEPFREASRTVTFEPGEGLPGRVFLAESPEWIPDASAEPAEVFRRTAFADETGLQAALGVPITTDDGVVAVLTFALRERRPADEQLLEVVTDVAADLGQLVARKRTEEALERIRRIIESLRPINRELVRAGTREDIDALVCEQLTTAEMYQFAWVGDYNAATERITPREWAGIQEEFLRELDLDLFEDGAEELSERAVSEGTVQARQEVTMGSREQDRALTYGYQSRAVVPVVYGDTVHGVISVYSARSDAFDEYERGLLAELGERIGHAINAAEHKQLLHTDTVVELEFEVGDGSPLVAAAGGLDCWLSLNNVVPASDSEYVCYVDVDGADPEALAERLQDEATVDRTRVVTARGETGVVEVTGELGVATTLIEHGASVRSFEAGGEGGTLVAETAPQSDLESIITDVEDAYDGTVFTAKRTLDREVGTLRMTRTAVEEALTDCQQEALALAYHAGYFESPRDSTGEELAEALGVSSPTFYDHVRKALRKIVGLTIDGGDVSTPPRSR